MRIFKFIANIPERRKVLIGIVGHAIFLPFLFHSALQSPMFNVGGALILTLMFLFGTFFITTLDYSSVITGKVWVDQTLGVWLLKSSAGLAFLVVMPYFRSLDFFLN